MWLYWILFCTAAFVAATAGSSVQNRGLASHMAWAFTFVVLTGAIGLRNEVGGDWHSYLRAMDAIRGLPFDDVIGYGDPAYQALSWWCSDFRDGMILVNLVCGLIFTLGLVAFCRSLPRPWLALSAAIPYLVIVVGMGYTRQSVALGCWMLGLVALKRGAWLKFGAWVLFGAMFHKSAVVLLPLPLLLIRRNWFLSAIATVCVFALGYATLLQDSVDELYTNYVEAQYQSEGALIRLMMSVIPATILIFSWRRLKLPELETSLWRWLSFISVGLLAVLVATPSSTAVDRLALYLLPLQLVVVAHAPDLIRIGSRGTIIRGALFYSFLVQFVWLNFAHHAIAWVPYNMYFGYIGGSGL